MYLRASGSSLTPSACAPDRPCHVEMHRVLDSHETRLGSALRELRGYAFCLRTFVYRPCHVEMHRVLDSHETRLGSALRELRGYAFVSGPWSRPET